MTYIEYEMTQGQLVFKDAISIDDNQHLSAIEIESIKLKRFAAWIAVVTGPAPVESTLEYGVD